MSGEFDDDSDDDGGRLRSAIRARRIRFNCRPRCHDGMCGATDCDRCGPGPDEGDTAGGGEIEAIR